MPDESGEQVSDFGHGEGNQIVEGTGAPFLAAASAVMARKAWASIAKVMCRYQES